MKPPEVDQAKIQEALYHFCMFIRCMVDATGTTESETQPAVFDIKNACRYIACRPTELMQLRTLGEIEPIEMPHGLRWRKADLDAYLEKCVAASEAGDESAELAGL